MSGFVLLVFYLFLRFLTVFSILKNFHCKKKKKFALFLCFLAVISIVTKFHCKKKKKKKKFFEKIL